MMFCNIDAHEEHAHYEHKHEDTRVQVCAEWVLWKQAVGMQSSGKDCSYSPGGTKAPSHQRGQKMTRPEKFLSQVSQIRLFYFNYTLNGLFCR